MNEGVKVPDNAEIDAALKEYERQKALESKTVSSEPVETPEPLQNNETGVTFEEDMYRGKKFEQKNDLPKMVEAVIKHSGGIIKSENQANMVLVFFILIVMTISFLLFFGLPHFGQSKEEKLGQEVMTKMHPELFKK